tara:strand:- start:50 stop:487 length:438 start_codon:yes stop_codon:yes gene_type:complete
MKNQWNTSDYWFLDDLRYAGAALRVELSQGMISPIPQDVAIDPGVAVHDAREISITPESPRLRIHFSNVLAYQVTDESIGFAEPQEGRQKTFLSEHTTSSYLTYVMKHTILQETIDQDPVHFSLALADDVIDVIAAHPPNIQELS